MRRLKLHQNEAASIETNSYSIVSKRSVEKLYFARDVQYLEPFVPAFKRRAPLINRGYWLRMRAIEAKVESFLTRGAGRKVVVNLGCGFDVLPFRMRSKGEGANLFVDIDYPGLIHLKAAIVKREQVFKDALGDRWHVTEKDGRAELESDWYRMVGCDLGDLQGLDKALTDILNSSESVLFIAEVSITYMPFQKADALLEWAAKFKKGRIRQIYDFCIDRFQRSFVSWNSFCRQGLPIPSPRPCFVTSQSRLLYSPSSDIRC
jgi:tRNA wybutosine-synthesizing protein 4